MDPVSAFPDVAGPGLIVGLGLGLGVALVLVVVYILVEAAVLRLLRWGTFGRSLLASLVMNVVSGAAGLLLLALIDDLGWPLWLLVAYGLTVLIEGTILVLMRRGHARLNWAVAAVANVATYVPTAVLFAVLIGRQ